MILIFLSHLNFPQELSHKLMEVYRFLNKFLAFPKVFEEFFCPVYLKLSENSGQRQNLPMAKEPF